MLLDSRSSEYYKYMGRDVTLETLVGPTERVHASQSVLALFTVYANLDLGASSNYCSAPILEGCGTGWIFGRRLDSSRMTHSVSRSRHGRSKTLSNKVLQSDV